MTFVARRFFSRTFVYFAHSTKLVVFSSFVVAISLYFHDLVVLSVSLSIQLALAGN